MVRRKGEKPLDRRLFWTDGCCVERMIRGGDSWLEAWTLQQTVTQADLLRATGMSPGRLRELACSIPPTSEELAALAAVLRTDLASLEASIAYERSIEETPF